MGMFRSLHVQDCIWFPISAHINVANIRIWGVLGGVLHIRRFSDSDSGGSGSATFSIDLTQGDSSSQNEGECGAGDVRGSINTGASFLRERVDKENVAARVGLVPSKNSILRTSDQSLSSSDSTNKYPRCSQDNATICESRPILGSVPFNHWNKTPTGPRTEVN